MKIFVFLKRKTEFKIWNYSSFLLETFPAAFCSRFCAQVLTTFWQCHWIPYATNRSGPRMIDCNTANMNPPHGDIPEQTMVSSQLSIPDIEMKFPLCEMKMYTFYNIFSKKCWKYSFFTSESFRILTAISSGLANPAPAEMIFVSSGLVRFSFSNPGVSVKYQ